jgi:hypothetical protein
MNETEYALTVLIEELAESQQRACKALRFGLDNIESGKSETNEQALWRELSDMQGAAERFQELRGQGGTSRVMVDAKKIRIAEFSRYSEHLGCLQSGNVAV